MFIDARTSRTALACALIAALSACGGGATGSGSGAGAAAVTAPNATASTATQQAQLLTLSLAGQAAGGAASVPVGGNATLSATLVDSNGTPQPNVLVTFAAPAIAALNPSVGTALSDANGIASIAVEGLQPGAGVATATATIGGTQRTASLAFSVVPASSSGSVNVPTSGSVEFVAATKQTLNIAGTGSAATSDVSFRVLDQSGQPLANQTVTFTPTVTTGGIGLQPPSAVSDAQGIVRTTITAGGAPTPVRVNAVTTINGSAFSGQSRQLSISSGNPTQKFFSVSATTLNIDGCDLDGAQTQINARAGDQFGNPVPDGTTVNFVTEGGRVGAASVGSCQTTNGTCSVSLESQEFRPRGQAPAWNNCRVTVLAYAVGQETFTDLNSNYRYDAGEPFDDLPDAFLNTQPLVRRAPDPAYPWTSAGLSSNLAMGPVNFRAGTDTLLKFVDVGQSAPVADGQWGSAHVRGMVEIVLSGRVARFCQSGYTPSTGSTFSCSPIAEVDLGHCTPGVAASGLLAFSLADQNGNPLPAGSPVTVEASSGLTLGTLSPAAVPNTVSISGTPHSASVSVTPTSCPGANALAGSVLVKVTPGGGAEQSAAVNVRWGS